jgi:hypothetical protein
MKSESLVAKARQEIIDSASDRGNQHRLAGRLEKNSKVR